MTKVNKLIGLGLFALLFGVIVFMWGFKITFLECEKLNAEQLKGLPYMRVLTIAVFGCVIWSAIILGKILIYKKQIDNILKPKK